MADDLLFRSHCRALVEAVDPRRPFCGLDMLRLVALELALPAAGLSVAEPACGCGPSDQLRVAAARTSSSLPDLQDAVDAWGSLFDRGGQDPC